MTILTLQRRLREIGRIRIGNQAQTSNGRTRPNKLDRFRLTCGDPVILEAAASLYGGKVEHWDAAPIGDQYELFTDAAEMAVIVPPGDTAISQFYETWTGGGCIRRCDGQTELLSGAACLCANENEPSCKPTTRLSVILSDLPGLGVWRLESHGYYAATELAGTVDVCHAAAQGGQLLPAVLRLEQRQTRRIVNGKPETRNFAVPTLDVRLSPSALGVGTGKPATWKSIAASSEDEDELVEMLDGPREVRAAIAAPARPPTPKRANSAPEIKGTGLAPRAAVGSAIPEVVAAIDELPPVTNGGGDVITVRQRNMIFALLRGNPNSSDLDSERQHAYCATLLGIPTLTTLDELTKTQASQLIDELKG